MSRPDGSYFYHAIIFNHEVCIGCSHCMRVCPTEALRIRDGKALLIGSKCIDCGECFRVCPVSAITVAGDELNEMFGFGYRIALIPAVFLGQFPETLSREVIFAALNKIGFTHIFEIERCAEILCEAQKNEIRNKEHGPAPISAFCPAVVRLIQVKFPGLADNIILLKPPVDLAALYCRQQLAEQGVPPGEIGLFYLTPCAAKMAAVKSPVGETVSPINGVMNMNSVYNKVLTIISQEGGLIQSSELSPSPSKLGILWSLTHGEGRNISGRVLSIDGINNVTAFLEKLEDEKSGSIDFLEMRTCDQGCAGGILVSGNRFLTAEKLFNKAACLPEDKPDPELLKYKSFLLRHAALDKITPRTSLALDSDMVRAMNKMKKQRDLMQLLPDIDCGVCGSPSCQALAEDVVNKEAALSYCIFIQKLMEQDDQLTITESNALVEKIWGKKRIK